ncbi:unnamed protein product [Cuscuta campestris]|uniref:Uncharacterized protein n=2 Tax=Cuscuta sect. Cleistogrammica TaxID=1824901 RepID=A0A484KIJ3_9ASTE|nr:hypothetical protein DM860_015412 [Cuscuta australis]VFQ62957.1 unnamed protein product [Cuscuta campestris]
MQTEIEDDACGQPIPNLPKVLLLDYQRVKGANSKQKITPDSLASEIPAQDPSSTITKEEPTIATLATQQKKLDYDEEFLKILDQEPLIAFSKFHSRKNHD